jgi:CMP-N-acetylneuraminic acid synthetase
MPRSSDHCGALMRIVAIIPARAGSKRLPGKNRMDIEPGISLVQQAIDCAVDCGLCDLVAVLTDDHRLDFKRAQRVAQPAELASDSADISAAVSEATERIERSIGTIDYIVTLQPAVVARSALIVQRVVQAVLHNRAGGAVTAARTVPWQWRMRGTQAVNDWHPGPYPRSATAGHHLAEINAVQVASRAAVAAGHRWGLPLLLAELPEWAAALDIDEATDMRRARDLWEWAKPRLETWEPVMHLATTINGWAA